MSQNGDVDDFQIIAEKPVPSVYTDSVGFEISVYGVTLEFGQLPRGRARSPDRVPAIPQVRIHMSPQHAKVMAKLFVKNMKAYEDQIGKIDIPKALLDDLKLEEEW